jgi:hypothetical protein
MLQYNFMYSWLCAVDDESPMVSGSGHVTKDITDEELLKDWDETLRKWHANLSHRPKQV